MNTPDILTRILATKAEEIEAEQAAQPLKELKLRCTDMPACRGFSRAMRTNLDQGKSAIIAEAKKASPSKGVIRENFNIAEIANSYAAGGATCLSILTDQDYFKGNLSFLDQARAVCNLPVLRKDFMINEYQLYQSRIAGADCILLIVAALEQIQLMELAGCAHDIGLDVLVEVHNAEELQRVLGLENVLLGINNRNLRTFETSLQTTIGLLDAIPPGRIVVTESGIHTKEDVVLMHEHGVHAFLIGEAFMRADSPGEKLKELFE